MRILKLFLTMITLILFIACSGKEPSQDDVIKFYSQMNEYLKSDTYKKTDKEQLLDAQVAKGEEIAKSLGTDVDDISKATESYLSTNKELKKLFDEFKKLSYSPDIDNLDD